MFEKAAKLFKMAADMGNIEAGTQYGILYSKGLLHSDSLEEPIEYLKKAAYQLSDDALIEYGAFLVKENPIIQLNFKFKAYISDLIDIGFSESMIYKLVNNIKKCMAANKMFSKNKRFRKYFNMEYDRNNDDDDDSDSSDSDIIEFSYHLNELFDDDEQNDNDNNNNKNNNDEQNIDDDEDEDDEIINNEKVLFETFMECQKQGLSPKEISSILALIRRRLEHKFNCNNDKDSIPEEKLTVSYLRQIVRNLIGKPDETTEKDTIPDLRGKTIHDIKVNLYKSYEFVPILYYIYLSHFTLPEPIRDEINQELKASPFYQYSAQSLCHQKDPNDIYDFYFFTPFISIQSIHSCLTKVMKKFGFESYFAPIQETLPFEDYLYFSESMLPDETLNLLLKFLKTHHDVEEIKRNIFDGKQIATHIIIKRNSYINVIKSIRDLLTQQGILFESYKYPLQNNIIINEKMILQEKNDFYVILNEIKSLKIEPISIECDKLYLYDYYFVRKLFQRFSFICFKNEIEKMTVVNHLNSILYKDKSNVLQYNTEYIYAAIDDHFYPRSNYRPKYFDI